MNLNIGKALPCRLDTDQVIKDSCAGKLMEPARLELGKAIEVTPIVEPVCPVYQNVTAIPETDPEKIKANLLAQLTSPVRWTQSVKAMIADGADTFVELGPGAVLQGLVKRISGAAGAEVTIEGKQ